MQALPVMTTSSGSPAGHVGRYDQSNKKTCTPGMQPVSLASGNGPGCLLKCCVHGTSQLKKKKKMKKKRKEIGSLLPRKKFVVPGREQVD